MSSPFRGPGQTPHLAFLITLFLCSWSFTAPPTTQHSEAFQAAVTSRLHLMRNLSVSFSIDEKFNHEFDPTTKQAFSADGHAVVAPVDQISTQHVSFLNGKGRWEIEWPEAASRALGLKHSIEVFTGDHVESFLERPQSTSGMIVPASTIYASLFEIGIGVRLPDSIFAPPRIVSKDTTPWLSSADYEAMTEEADTSGNVTIQGHDKNHRTHLWNFGRDLGYALTHYTILTRSGLKFAEVEPSDFRKVGDFSLPFAIRLQAFQPRTGKKAAEQTAKVISLTLNDPRNTDDLYAIHWPKGMTVTDTRTDVHHLVTEDNFVMTDERSAGLALAEHGRPGAASIPPVQARNTSKRSMSVFLACGAAASACIGTILAVIAYRRRIAIR